MYIIANIYSLYNPNRGFNKTIYVNLILQTGILNKIVIKLYYLYNYYYNTF